MNFLKNVKIFQGLYISFLLIICIFYTVSSAPQQPEINDQYGTLPKIEEIVTPNETIVPKNVIVPPNETVVSKNVILTANETVVTKNVTVEENEVLPEINKAEIRRTDIIQTNEEPFFTKLRNMICRPIIRILSIPKISAVLRNVGTCMVNGAMELVTYYFPPPLIPLIATAAGMIIPFEPVVMLREKMPVTSYRRAFKSALNGFLGTFDKYKMDEEDDDPYMTRRFNRRMMSYSGEKKD